MLFNKEFLIINLLLTNFCNSMTKKSQTNHPDAEFIERLGGTFSVAKICGLTAPSVSEWKSRGIPRSWKMYLELKYPKKVIDNNDSIEHAN